MQKNKPHFKVSFSIFVSVIVCSLLFVFALISSAAETAPGQNDTTGTATRINVNQTYSDNIVKSSDVDYFTFTTSSAGYVQLEFTHGLLTDTSNNWYVYLYDSNLQEIGKIDVPGNITSKKTAQTGIPAGTYYIKVEDGWNFSDITYQIKAIYSSSNYWEKEKNETAQTANSISLNSTYSGAVYNNSDLDFYTFTTSNAGYVQLEFTHELLTDTNNNWYVYLYDSNLKEIGKIDVPGNITSKKTAQTGIPAGTYYIKVEDGWNHSNVTYQIKAIYSSSNNWEKELNGDVAIANTISVNMAYSGAIYNNSDVDYFTFTTSSAGYTQLDFTHELLTDTNNNWYVYLYDSNLQEIGKIDVPGNITSKQSAKIGIPAGKYYIKVSNGWDHSSVTYQIKAIFSSSNYWEKERNETPQTANAISFNTLYSGSVYKNSDLDYFTFTTSSGYVQLEFTHEAISDTNNNWTITLYTNNLEKVIELKSKGNESSTVSDQASISSGTYYVKVEDGWNHSPITYGIKVKSSSASTYTVSYNANGGTGAPSSQTVTAGNSITIPSTAPTWTGHQFLGWSTSSSATTASYVAGNTYKPSGNTTFYAVWKQNSTTSYTVSYSANGGSGAPSSQTVTAGSSVTIPSTIPTRFPYTVLGWSTSSSASSASYLPGGSYTPGSSTTLYAVWKSATTVSGSTTVTT
ncbi:MAG: InlB B-repeat-containing protein, partial [Clostridia bacterium]|nr:InlB B-repeat-containing protein [Clostridia bacterium]